MPRFGEGEHPNINGISLDSFIEITEDRWKNADGIHYLSSLDVNHLRHIVGMVEGNHPYIRSLFSYNAHVELTETRFYKNLIKEIKRKEREDMIENNDFDNQSYDFNNYHNLNIQQLVIHLRKLLVFHAVAESTPEVPELTIHSGETTYEELIAKFKEEISLRRIELLQRERTACLKEVNKLKSREDKLADMKDKLAKLDEDIEIASKLTISAPKVTVKE